jgi:2,3-dihydroxybenzoate-AMP ligase
MRGEPLEGFASWPNEAAQRYVARGYWPNIPISDTLDRWVKAIPDRVAIVDDRTSLTYGELGQKVDRLALALRRVDIQKRDRIIVQLPNWVEFVIACYGITKGGAIPVMAIPQLRTKEISFLAHITEAVAIITPHEYQNFNYLKMVADLRPQLPLVRHVLVAGSSVPEGMLSLFELLDTPLEEEKSTDSLQQFRPDPNGAAIIFHTGGTTGLPKAVAHTHNSMLAATRGYIMNEIWNNDFATLVCVPAALEAFVRRIVACIRVGGKVVLRTSTRPQDMLSAVEKEGVTDMLLPPALAADLLAYPNIEKHDLRSLKQVYCGIGPITPEQVIALRQRLGCQIMRAYGSTEGLGLSTSPDDPFEVNLRYVGRPCCPDDELKFVDEQGNEVPPGEEGELIARGPHVIRSYYRAEGEDASSFDRDGFFHTGDYASMDDRGYIRITGRKKDWIRRGGQTVIPLEVEELLMSHSKVEKAAVVAMPDPRLGERACAYVITKPGQTLTLEEAVTYLLGKGLAKYKLPERLEVVARIPLTSHGKVDKKLLREDIAQKLEAQGRI